jgi:TrmH family RNA methyltransferase
MTREAIRSRSNPLLKRCRLAAAGRAVDEILLEGDRLVDDARRAGLELRAVLVAEERVDRLAELRSAAKEVRAVAGELLARAGTLEHAPGCLALASMPRARGLADLWLSAEALVVVAAGIQDPGNLGALARTAEAAGAEALLVVRGGCRPWNPKALRGSMGSLLRLPVVEPEAGDGRETVLEPLARLGFRNVAARTRGGVPHYRFDWRGRLALWLCAESGTFPRPLAGAAERFEGVSIPMASGVESLNVTAAAAVLLFGAARVRRASEP